MPDAPEDHYLAPYREAQLDHGSDFRVTLWASERSQRLRFRVMTEMVFLAGKRVLDAGCSRGDFAAYMVETGFAYERFIGVDAVEQVIGFATDRELPRSRFVAGDFVTDPGLLSLESPQVITISGALSTMTDDVALDVLERAWEAAQETLMFNFLSDQAGPEAPKQLAPARRLPTMKLLEWAMSRSPAVKFRQDYFRFGHDATIVMRKG